MRSCWMLPPCPTEPMQAGSKMDLLLAKAKPISDGGSASGITQFRKGKNPAERQLQWERRVKTCKYVRDATLQSPRSVHKEQRRCSRHPAASGVDHGGVDPHSQPTLEQGGARKRL